MGLLITLLVYINFLDFPLPLRSSGCFYYFKKIIYSLGFLNIMPDKSSHFNISQLFSLLRVSQWYKNLTVFLPIFFAQRLSDLPYLISVVLAFFSLSLASSSGYIINDIIDRKKDAAHPLKKKRPLASGAVSVSTAILLSVLLLLSSLSLGLSLSLPFVFFVAVLFLLMLSYSLFFRNELFADIILISINFVVRSVSGAYTLSTSLFEPYVTVSPWLLICTFFLALFLASVKRRAEAVLAVNTLHRAGLSSYDKHTSYYLLALSSTMLILSYSFYTFFAGHEKLLLTVPLSIYAVLRFAYLTENRPELCIHAQHALKDRKLFIASLAWLLVTLLIFYA
ncbi:hypothetical protein D6764_01700 [Candidatus Woesearchaeota archaeon]|nr:MAG: hypothetical protein D6764_01700 [Candidatus Woesearchaeota archaeon]